MKEVIENGLKMILEAGFPWFDNFNGNETVLNFLKKVQGLFIQDNFLRIHAKKA